jgi:hypothetical protein
MAASTGDGDALRMADAMAGSVFGDESDTDDDGDGTPDMAKSLTDGSDAGDDTSTPLSDAPPFDYQPDAPGNEIDELAGTTNERYAAKMLGYDRSTFREMIHRFKKTNGIGPDDDLEFESNGDVYFDGEYLDNFHDYGN